MRAGRKIRWLCGIAALIGVAGLPMAATAPAAAADAFDRWLAGVGREARQKGIGGDTITAAFRGVRPIPKVIKHLKHQPEFTMTLAEYLRRVVSEERVALGRARLAENRTLLRAVGRKYGVQPRFIVALWGIETKYGQITGGFPVVGALATLAYRGARRRYFRSELINALRILQQGHITVDRMTGSWAGAMGQIQFMPSSFLRLAVDHDGDGRRDIWGSRADIFASSANYLARNGWRAGQSWGREVRLPAKFNPGLADRRVWLRLDRWTGLGVRRADGGPLPRVNIRGRILRPARNGGRAFIVYRNFRVILRWNRSNYFALAVGQLADRIAARRAGAKPEKRTAR